MRVGPILALCSGAGLCRELVLKGDAPVAVSFSKYALPLTGTHAFTRRAIVARGGTSIPYRLKVPRDTPLSSEAGIPLADVVVYTKGGWHTGSIQERSIIPDFTTPYLVYGLCGTVIVGIVSAFSKVLLGLV
ncbi:hypothetical protein NEDG_00745 [Nematocida displodere]|uniref:Uncharacterized protein n=1 Tax=Nematocida displodere TaxID=1805483 RepID=A0A177EEP6_9MICR|nr:hypothetical protein NEDG_00745 [Nematocida displodere]